MTDSTPLGPQPTEPAEANDPSMPTARARRSRRFPQAIEVVGGAALLLSTTALLPVIEPKLPPFRGD